MADRDAEGILIRLHDDLEAIASKLVDVADAIKEHPARSEVLFAAGQLEGMCKALNWQGYVPDA